MAHLFRQSFFIPEPPITEQNCPDQTGRVHIVTGGYTGCGLELAKILYAANATVYVAGRSSEKGSKAMIEIRDNARTSNGKVDFLQVDLSDLRSIKPAVDDFRKKESTLHVLTNNAGVMQPPAGSCDAQGLDLQFGTNLAGPHLLTKLLYPVLKETAAKSAPGSVRVTWAGSLAVDLSSYKPGGLDLDDEGQPREKDIYTNYGQTKAGNLYLAQVYAKRSSKADGVVQCCWNPGNLQTELQRHMPWWQSSAIAMILYPPRFGAYTELYSAVSPDLVPRDSAYYIVPWGREGQFRSDIAQALRSEDEGGTGKADLLYQWLEKHTAAYS